MGGPRSGPRESVSAGLSRFPRSLSCRSKVVLALPLGLDADRNRALFYDLCITGRCMNDRLRNRHREALFLKILRLVSLGVDDFLIGLSLLEEHALMNQFSFNQDIRFAFF